RRDPGMRKISIAALLDARAEAQEPALREAGANAVLCEWQSAPIWDDAFLHLLSVPKRRWVTIPVMLGAYGRPPGQMKIIARNISVRGMLIETARPLPRDVVMDLSFALGIGPTLRMESRVVWD